MESYVNLTKLFKLEELFDQCSKVFIRGNALEIESTFRAVSAEEKCLEQELIQCKDKLHIIWNSKCPISERGIADIKKGFTDHLMCQLRSEMKELIISANIEKAMIASKEDGNAVIKTGDMHYTVRYGVGYKSIFKQVFRNQIRHLFNVHKKHYMMDASKRLVRYVNDVKEGMPVSADDIRCCADLYKKFVRASIKSMILDYMCSEKYLDVIDDITDYICQIRSYSIQKVCKMALKTEKEFQRKM